MEKKIFGNLVEVDRYNCYLLELNNPGMDYEDLGRTYGGLLAER